MTLPDVLKKLADRLPLSASEMTQTMEQIMTGGVDTDTTERFLVSLREKGETYEEVLSAARVMRAHAVKLTKTYPEYLDTCGTGGDTKNTLNVSTLAAIVAASCGVKIAKHGNRSVSSVCGSADLLELLGFKIASAPEVVERQMEKTGFGFFFAPAFHPAVKHAMEARKRIKGKTLFNILGPLCNPAGTKHQLIGIYESRLGEIFAQVLKEFGSKHALIIHAESGLDEIALEGKTRMWELKDTKIVNRVLAPGDFGIAESAAFGDIQCKTKEDSKKMAILALSGQDSAAASIVALNAGAAIYAADHARSIEDGVSLARESMKKGAARAKCEEIVQESVRG